MIRALSHIRLVLVSPMYGGNLGSVARICANFDLRDVVLVSPLCSPSDEEALKYAVRESKEVLAGFRTVATLQEALAGCALSIAFNRKDNQPLSRPWSCAYAADLLGKPGPIALVFGREDNGLTNEEAALCSVECAIPTSAFITSMNLSHSIAVVASALYGAAEERRGSDPSRPQPDELDLPADHGDVSTLIEHLRALVADAGINRGTSAERLHGAMAQALRRAVLSRRDVGFFRAFFSKAQGAIGRAGTRSPGQEDG